MATEKGQATNTANPILTRAATEDSVLRNYYSETYSQDKKVGLLVFRIGDGVFAVASLKTQEIIRSVDITRVPHLEKYILGITNLRGKILPICDLRHFFGLKNTIFDRDTRVIVAKFNQGSIGFVVDEVVDTIHVAVSSLEKNNSSVSSLQFDGFISGVCNHKDGIIFLLNILKVAGIESAPGESDPLNTFLNMLGDKEGGKGGERSGGDGGGDASADTSTDASTNASTDAATDDANASTDTATDDANASTDTATDDADADADAGEMSIDEMIAMELASREKAMAERYHGAGASTSTDASTNTDTNASTDANANVNIDTNASTNANVNIDTNASTDDTATSTDASTNIDTNASTDVNASTSSASLSGAMTSGEALSKLFSTLNNEYASHLIESRSGGASSGGVSGSEGNFKELVAVFGLLGSGAMVADQYPQKFYGASRIPQDMGALIQMETRSRSR